MEIMARQGGFYCSKNAYFHLYSKVFLVLNKNQISMIITTLFFPALMEIKVSIKTMK